MNIKKNFLSRMTRRKSSTPAEPEEGAYEIPSPSAIGRMPSDSSRRAESMESGYGLDLELLASDKPPRPDSANGMNAQESGHAPALESSPAPISDESPDAPKPPRALEMHQEYGLELEVLAASESDESPDAPEPPQEDDESASSMVESAAKASAPDTEAIGDSAPAHEESLAAPVSDELPDESEPSHDSEPFEGYGAGFEVLAAPESSESPDEVVASHAPEPLPEDEVDPEVSVAAAVSDDLPDAPEPLREHEEAASAMVESAAKASAPDVEAIGDSAPAHEESLATSVSSESSDEPVLSHDPEPFEGYGADFEVLAAPDSSESPDEAESFQEDEASSSIPVAPDLPLEQPEEPSESPIANIGYFPLVRDARGNWRPGKGFSRSELQEAGLSLAEAARLRVRVDKRRRNAHPMNVATLEKAKNGG